MSSLIFLFAWVILFIINKKYRKEIFLVSIVTLFLGYFVEQMHFMDWWQPKFIFDWVIHIEDIIFGFSCGGFISGTYYVIRHSISKTRVLLFTFFQKVFLILGFLLLLFGLFYLFHIHSFWSSISARCLPIFVVAWNDIRSLFPIVCTGVSVLIFVFLGYQFCIYINPNFIKETYLLNHLSNIFIFDIPIEELGWFFFAGMGIPAFQKILWR